MRRIYLTTFKLIFVCILLTCAAPIVAQRQTAAQKSKAADKIFGEVFWKLSPDSHVSEKLAAVLKLEAARALYKAAKNKGGEFMCLLMLGGIHHYVGEKQKAADFYSLALPLVKTSGGNYDRAETFNLIGKFYFELGEKQKALDLFNEALPLTRTRGSEWKQADTLSLIGKVYDSRGEKQKALEFYNRALSLSGNSFEVLNNIGKVYAALGDNRKALEFYNQALDDKLTEMRAVTLNNIGTAHLALGENQNAGDSFYQAYQISSQIGYKFEEAVSLHNLGLFFDASGDNPEALEIYNKRLRKEGTDSAKDEATSEDLKKSALNFYEQSLPLRRFIGDKAGEAETLHNIGAVYDFLGDKEKALAHYHESLPLRRLIEDKEGEAKTLGKLTVYWNNLKNPRFAAFYGKQTINVYQQLRSNISGLDQAVQKTFLQTIEDKYKTLADILINEGRLLEAQQVLDLLKEQEFFEFVRRDAAEAREQAKLVLTAAERDALNEYAKVSNNLTALGKKFQILQDKKNKFGTAFSAADETQYQSLKIQLETANQGAKIFLGKLALEFSKKVEDEAVITPKTVETMKADLRRAGDDVVLISTYLLPDRYRVIITTGRTMVDRKVEYQDLKLTDAKVNQKIALFRQALLNPNYDPRPVGKELYDIFVKPIEADLTAANAKTLLWSLDGSLRYVPMGALFDGEKYLAQRYENVLVTLARQSNLWTPPTKHQEWRALGLGVSKAHTGFSALPAVLRELRSIIREDGETANGILDGLRLEDEKFDAETFRTNLSQLNEDGKPFNVVHLATHFKLGATNADSVLLLGDGKRLSLFEISKDEALDFKDVDLLALSACQTGISINDSNGREIESFGMMAQQKGAKAILATLWSVADNSTQILMSEFYRLRRANPQLTKAAAMRQAQINMLEGTLKPGENEPRGAILANQTGTKLPPFKFDAAKPFAHPYFWSPFVLIGNWR